LKTVSLSLLILFVTILSGPVLDLTYQIKMPTLPADLDSYLTNLEKKYTDITSGAEKKILWFDNNTKQKTQYSIIYLHGFSASRQEISPVVETLGSEMKANVFLTRFIGHGRSDDAMLEITIDRLINDTVEAFEIGKRLGEKVIVVGTSTGATLASWLAFQKQFTELAGLILISPNYGLKNKASEWLLKPWAKVYMPFIMGKQYQFTAQNELQEKFWTTRYPSEALFPLMGTIKVVRDQSFSQLTLPVLVMYSKQDQVVDPDWIEKKYNEIASQTKSLIEIKNSKGSQSHVLAGEILSPDSTDAVLSHIREFLTKI